jgi:drug/metabolite transporter (DMT)-like permease
LKTRLWLYFAILTTAFWGVWGALIELPEKNGFPATLGYSVWALTMIPCALVALSLIGWKLDGGARRIFLGCAVGLTGAGGQLILFEALRLGPAYLIFPIISLYPVLTVMLAYALLRERARMRTWTGVILSFPAIAMLSYQPPGNAVATSHWWLALAAAVFVLWGVQAYVMKFATGLMPAESLYFYMMVTAVALIPVALAMTDFSRPINWGFRGPGYAALIQVLNSIGALMLVYALRHGKAIVVVPMTSLAPVITVILSLLLYHLIPHPVVIAGLVLASIAILLMAE